MTERHEPQSISTALTNVTQSTAVAIQRRGLVLETIDDYIRFAGVLIDSGLVKIGNRSKEQAKAEAVIQFQYGAEIGLEPMASWTQVYIVNGKIGISAQLMGAKIKQSGKYNYSDKNVPDCAIVEFTEFGKPIGVRRFSMDDAKRAGLTKSFGGGPSSYEKYGPTMLFWRALSQGARELCPDVLGPKTYTQEELEQMEREHRVRQAHQVSTPEAKPKATPAKAQHLKVLLAEALELGPTLPDGSQRNALRAAAKAKDVDRLANAIATGRALLEAYDQRDADEDAYDLGEREPGSDG